MDYELDGKRPTGRRPGLIYWTATWKPEDCHGEMPLKKRWRIGVQGCK